MERTEKPRENTDIPTFENFLEDIEDTGYSEGNLEIAYKKIKYAVENYYTLNKEPVTYEFIMAKFKQHLEAWAIEFGKRESKYIGKEDRKKRMTIYDFMSQKGYMKNWGNQMKMPRDQYLFPNMPKSKLEKKVKAFKDKYNLHETKK